MKTEIITASALAIALVHAGVTRHGAAALIRRGLVHLHGCTYRRVVCGIWRAL